MTLSSGCGPKWAIKHMSHLGVKKIKTMKSYKTARKR